MSKRTVGTYVPPAKRVKSEKFDPASEADQRSKWDDSKKKITGLINRANISNITIIVEELFKLNLIRYKGLFASALLKAQETSPAFTDIYVALLTVINSRLKTVGSLIITRALIQFKTSLKSTNKLKCHASAKMIAHLINQWVLEYDCGFHIAENLLHDRDNFSIEAAVEFIKECGLRLEEQDPIRMSKLFSTLRHLSMEVDDTRIDELIHELQTIKKDRFSKFPPVKSDLDLVEEDDRVTHEFNSEDLEDGEGGQPNKDRFMIKLNYFQFDPNWSANEAKYEDFKKSLFDEDDDEDEDDSGEGSDEEEKTEPGPVEEQDKPDEKPDVKPVISATGDTKSDKASLAKVLDETGQDLVSFRRMIYLTIKSSARHEEVVHKILKEKIPVELHDELCNMLIDCCGQERTYMTVYGLVAANLCRINGRAYGPIFEKILQLFYETVHRFSTAKIENVAKFYGHLLASESIDWSCLSCLKLRENSTTSAGRCFIKFLIQELVSLLSLNTLLKYLRDPSRQDAFSELFPRDQEQDIRFAINFFTCCNLGALTEDLRKELAAKTVVTS